ncbi:MAG: nucleotidyltransferase domain-containing protein [Planctomycetes bacterium]|nr:nucleotidyltransferase domain-containing protein [Planctomycetota bacterium]
MDPNVERALSGFIDAAKAAFSADLRAVVLFGSAAEDRLRPTSDVNVVVVLARFDAAAAERLREPLALAWTAIRLQAMFLLESEIPAAAEAFTVKFADIRKRHRVLHGQDPFTALQIPRGAAVAQLRQSLMNQVLRLREVYVDQGMHEERLVLAVADAAGPLRACASALLELEGAPAPTPREALQRLAGNDLDELRIARTERALPAGTSGPLLLRLHALAEAMLARARALA